MSDAGLVAGLVDWSVILSLIFGGCCSNAWSLGRLLQSSPAIGSALTFTQFLVIAGQQLPKFLVIKPIPGTKIHLIPGLRPRKVPLSRWVIDVLLIAAGSWLNNKVFALRIPLTVQIIFRSGGLAVSMLFGYLRFKRKYTYGQVFCVILVTVGVVVATLASRPPSNKLDKVGASVAGAPAVSSYTLGVLILAVGLVLSGFLGQRQESTYAIYGPQWQEALFYTQVFSIPVYSLFWDDVTKGWSILSAESVTTSFSVSPFEVRIPAIYWVFLLNVVSQVLCVRGVNMLTTRVSSVGVNLILTARKTVSVMINVLYLGEGWNWGLVSGAGLVILGTVGYTLAGSRAKQEPQKDSKKME